MISHSQSAGFMTKNTLSYGDLAICSTLDQQVVLYSPFQMDHSGPHPFFFHVYSIVDDQMI